MTGSLSQTRGRPEPGETVAPDHICCTKVIFGDSIGFIAMGGPVYRIRGEDSSRDYTFEWHPMWGPSRCHSVTGELLKDPIFSERSPFWKLFDRWTAGGKRVDAFGRCILAPKPEPCAACAGRGFIKREGDKRRWACRTCDGLGYEVAKIKLEPRSLSPADDGGAR